MHKFFLCKKGFKVSKHSMKSQKSYFKTKMSHYLTYSILSFHIYNKLDVEMRATNIESISVKDQCL